MLSVSEAIDTLLEGCKRLVDHETIDLIDASGRTLAGDIIAPIDVPPADNSAMDGYVLCHADYKALGGTLPISQRIVAGVRPQPLMPGTAGTVRWPLASTV